jgi:hypothetical protein
MEGDGSFRRKATYVHDLKAYGEGKGKGKIVPVL